MEVLTVDNKVVRETQIEKIEKVRETRDKTKYEQSIQDLIKACQTGGNVLEKAIVCAKNRATLGEISLAMEKVFGRHVAADRLVSGAYSNAFVISEELKKVQEKVVEFANLEGRRPRILVSKMGQDGHDRGAKVIATGFADIGFDVDLGPLFQTPEEVAQQAIDADVHCIGVSTLAAGHRTLVPQLYDALKKVNRE